jgi:hypothetical protein
METAGTVVLWGLGVGISLYVGKKIMAYIEEKVSEHKVQRLILEIQQEQQNQTITLPVTQESWNISLEGVC